MKKGLNTPTGGYVVKYDGGTFSSEIGDNKKREFFARTLRRFNGEKPWALTLCPLRGRDYGLLLRGKEQASEFIQAAGRADAMTLEIRKPGGEQWGVTSVWGVIGHPASQPEPLDNAIETPHGSQMATALEIFDAVEAADVLYDYYTSGSISDHYAVRPIGGWTAAGEYFDLRQRA